MATFEIENKVALITGGASGLGFQYALGLLERGAKGVTLADINAEIGNQALTEIESKYGKNKAIFVKTDVSNYDDYEDAFKKTVEKFQNVDILLNNAGIMNDAIWEKEIAININGTIYGILLGLDNYLPKHKSGPEALIVNVSSVAGVDAFGSLPIYVGTKFAVHGMTLSWGLPVHYERTKVRVVGVCPGVTMTPLITESENRNLGRAYENSRIAELKSSKCLRQEPEQIVPGVMKVIEKAPSGTMWILEGGEPPYQYQMLDRFEIPKVHLEQ